MSKLQVLHKLLVTKATKAQQHLKQYKWEAARPPVRQALGVSLCTVKREMKWGDPPCVRDIPEGVGSVVWITYELLDWLDSTMSVDIGVVVCVC